jgi:hypothetical protein
MELNGLHMRVLIERTSDNKSWQVMIEDMLGKRPYNSKKFDYPDDAFNYITNEFENCSDVEYKIISDLHDN